MKQSSDVLKFGNWESQEEFSYTAYFEKARKHGSGEKPKQRGTQDKPSMPTEYNPPVQAPPFQKEVKMKASKDLVPRESKHKLHAASVHGKMWRPEDSSLHHDNVGRKAAVVLPHHQRNVGARSGGSKPELEAYRGPDASRLKHNLQYLSQEEGDSPSHQKTVGHRATTDHLNYQHNGGVNSGDKRSMRHSIGSDHGAVRLPLQPHYQPTVGGKSSEVVSSPSWQKKVSSYSISHGLNPSNQRFPPRPVSQGKQKLQDNTAVPKFGDWDESNPSAADRYTGIFEKVREEKQIEEGIVPATMTEPSYPSRQEHHAKKCCCFPWGGQKFCLWMTRK